MKNESQFSLQNKAKVFEKDIVLFDLSYLFKITTISIVTTLTLVATWHIAKPSQQSSEKSAEKVSKSAIVQITGNDHLELSSDRPEKLSKTNSISLLKIQSPPIETLAYNVKAQPQIRQSQDLQKIVDRAVNLAAKKGLPTTFLSVTLIDLKSGEEASYQQDDLRYPASVVKLYWLVMLQAQLQQKGVVEGKSLSLDLQKMIKKSDNEAASRVLDRITDTESGSDLNTQEFDLWLGKRKQANAFFIDAGYENLNISQKTFPIPYLNLYSPQGRELQMRQNLENLDKPIRNKITTKQTSRLMYEIVNRQAISSDTSSKMLDLLSIDAATRIKNRANQDPNIFNTVRGFFSQSLPDDIYFAAKAGWTSESRGETAYIATADRKTEYILTIFAEDRSYAYNWNIFPEMSRLVFDNIEKRNK